MCEVHNIWTSTKSLINWLSNTFQCWQLMYDTMRQAQPIWHLNRLKQTIKGSSSTIWPRSAPYPLIQKDDRMLLPSLQTRFSLDWAFNYTEIREPDTAKITQSVEKTGTMCPLDLLYVQAGALCFNASRYVFPSETKWQKSCMENYI